MAHSIYRIYRKIVAQVRKAAELARSAGIKNILQPGLIKEMVIAEILEHELIPAKRGPDAKSLKKPNELFEYLSCKEGGTGQLDRMYKEPNDKRERSLQRITRNSLIYLAVFYENDQLRCKVIYELSPKIVLEETQRQLQRSDNAISHIRFSESWARENGQIVYTDQRETD